MNYSNLIYCAFALLHCLPASTVAQSLCNSPQPPCKAKAGTCCNEECRIVQRAQNYSCSNSCTFDICTGASLECPKKSVIQQNGEPCTGCANRPCICTVLGTCAGQPSSNQVYLIVAVAVFVLVALLCITCQLIKGCFFN
ncbi:hypothetical protein HDE_08223 [Halotydeus destructor]|nr:hypothetical protein HDE_08223 [Halotydeus destructor]